MPASLPRGRHSQASATQLLGGIGRLTSAVSTVAGVPSPPIIAVLVIGIFIAIEPRLYDRGFAWMLPIERRDELLRIASNASASSSAA